MINKQDTESVENGEEPTITPETDQTGSPNPEAEPTNGEVSSMDNDSNNLAEALEAMEAKADDHWQRYLRTAAEMENVRKRAKRDVENARKFALERFAADIINVKDSLAMGLEAAKDNATVESLIEGSDMTYKLLDQTLSRHGVTSIEPLGEAFNPELHEALAMIDAPDAEPNSVVEVVQIGYEINGRLLRAARVVVAKS